jgi:hypothetical protein
VQASSGIYVQKCGSSQRTYLTTDPNKWSIRPFAASFYANDQAAGFCSSQSTGNSLVETLEGIYLASLVQFTAAVPPDGWCGVATLGPRDLYIEGPPAATSVLAAASLRARHGLRCLRTPRPGHGHVGRQPRHRPPIRADSGCQRARRGNPRLARATGALARAASGSAADDRSLLEQSLRRTTGMAT